MELLLVTPVELCLPPSRPFQAMELLGFLKTQLRGWFRGMVQLMIARTSMLPYLRAAFIVLHQVVARRAGGAGRWGCWSLGAGGAGGATRWGRWVLAGR